MCHGRTRVGGRLGGGSGLVSVSLAGVAARIISADDESVSVQAAYGVAVGSGDVLLTADTGAITTSTSGWAYLELGAIASASPQIAQHNTRVTIRGERFFGGGTRIEQVMLSSLTAGIISQSDNEVIVTAAESHGHDGTESVYILSDSGAFIQQDALIAYQAEGQITNVNPSTGQYGTILGTCLDMKRQVGNPRTVTHTCNNILDSVY